MIACTVAVIGHVDHGKTTIVKALTGTDTDTLEDEKRRRLTLKLGFAAFDFQERTIDLIDAPGHASLLRTTVSGLSGVNAILLVVSAADGIQAQTLEHVEIARKLGIRHAVAAITKQDLSEPDRVSWIASEVETLLSAAGIRAVSVCQCSTRTGEGIEQLKESLVALSDAACIAPELPGFYLPIDRVFSRQGVGTIITGTLIAGPVRTGDTGRLEPDSVPVQIRGLQINGNDVSAATGGKRLAVNVRGNIPSSLGKGDVLCSDRHYQASSLFDVYLEVPGRDDPPPRHMEEIVVLHGTGHNPARMRLYDMKADGNRGHVLAQLVFDRPQVAHAGQRFILQRTSQGKALMGGVILDPLAQDRRRDRSRQIRVLEASARGNIRDIGNALSDRDVGVVDVGELIRLARSDETRCRQQLAEDFEFGEKGLWVNKAALEQASSGLLKRLVEFHAARPLRPNFPKGDVVKSLRAHFQPYLTEQAIERLASKGEICLQADLISKATYNPLKDIPQDGREALWALEQRIRAGGFDSERETVLTEGNLHSEDLLELLVWSGRVVRLYNHALRQTVLLHTDCVEAARFSLAESFPPPQSFTTSEARQVLATNRKVIVPLLEYLDREGYTIRQENHRYFKV